METRLVFFSFALERHIFIKNHHVVRVMHNDHKQQQHQYLEQKSLQQIIEINSSHECEER